MDDFDDDYDDDDTWFYVAHLRERHLWKETRFAAVTRTETQHSGISPEQVSYCQTFCSCEMRAYCLMSQKMHLHRKWPTCVSAVASIVLNSMCLFECILRAPPLLVYHAWLMGNSE